MLSFMTFDVSLIIFFIFNLHVHGHVYDHEHVHVYSNVHVYFPSHVYLPSHLFPLQSHLDIHLHLY